MCRLKRVPPGWAALALFTILSGAAQGVTHNAQPKGCGTVSMSAAETVPFRLGDGFLIIVEGRIGSLPHLNFLVDTGATQTFVDKRIANELVLQRHATANLVQFNRSVKVECVDLPELELGPLRTRNVRALTGDLSKVSQYSPGIDAVIGLDVLQMTEDLRIDYVTRTLAFRASGEKRGAAPGRVRILSAHIQGRPVRLIVDTGIQTMILYEDRLRQHVPLFELTNRIEAHSGGLTGESAVLSRVQVGQTYLQAPVFVIHGAPQSGLADIDGFIGTSALKAKLVEFDFDKNTLRLK